MLGIGGARFDQELKLVAASTGIVRSCHVSVIGGGFNSACDSLLNTDCIGGFDLTYTYAATAGNVTIGTNTTGSTDWFVPNYDMTPFVMAFTTQLSGSATWNFETTNDLDYFDPPNGTNAGMVAPNVTAVVQGATIAQQVGLSAPVTGWRITITAGTGTLTVQGQQAGITNM